MVSCSEFLSELGAYLEGETPLEIRRELERHLAHCVTCQVIADSTAKTLKVVTESGEFDLSEELSQKVIDRIMERVRQPRPDEPREEAGEPQDDD